MAEIFRDSDIDLSVIKAQKIAVIGYGSQGRAHVLNLRDSGLQVRAGLYAGSRRWAEAETDGTTVVLTEEAASWADIIMMCTPDAPMGDIYCQSIAGNLSSGKTLLFAHGFSILYGLIKPPQDVNVGLVSPKGPGASLRGEYVAGRGLCALAGLHQDATDDAWQKILGYAWGIGAGRAAIFKTTFKEETESDLFGEQTVLCGGIPELLKAGFQTLVDAGFQPEVAYFECVHEAKLIIDLIYERGFAGMRAAISDTAEWGGQTTGQAVIGPEVRQAMQKALAEIQDGTFAQGWMDEFRAGSPRLLKSRADEASLTVEDAGRSVRAELPFLRDK